MTTADPARLAALLADCRVIAQAAGEEIMAVYRTAFTVDHKADRSPLTEADLRAHRLIAARLAELTPHWPLLSEEGADLPYAERRQWRTYWLVDPLDGTREFVKRNDEFTVNIALVHDHEPVLGVVHAPALGRMCYAARGVGAFQRRDGGEEQPLACRELPADELVVAGSRSHGKAALATFMARLGPHQVISMGSSLKFCLVAEGRADLYPRLGPTSEWDTAAAQCVVETAGGHVTDLDMRPLRYNTRDSLLNPCFFAFGRTWRDWSALLPEPRPDAC